MSCTGGVACGGPPNSRGLTGVQSLLLGSVSHAVLQHADRTVIVMPSPGEAAARGTDERQPDLGLSQQARSTRTDRPPSALDGLGRGFTGASVSTSRTQLPLSTEVIRPG